MTRVTYTGTARALRVSAHDVAVGRGETIDVADDVADALVADYEFVRGEPTPERDPPEFDVLAQPVSELQDQLDAGEHDGHLVALKREEEQHENRKTAKEAIDERRREVAEAEAEAESDEEGS